MSRMQTYGASGFIGGQLPPMGGGAVPIAGGTPQQIQGAYNTAYNSALAQNQANYQNILGGFQNVASGQRAAQDLIGAGYGDMGARARQRADEMRAAIMPVYHGPNVAAGGALGAQQDALGWAVGATGHGYEGRQRLYDQAMGDVESLGRTERMNIGEQYARSLGRATQSAASRGLGNTTVQDSLRRGVEFDKARAGIELEDQMTRQRLGVRDRFGLSMEDFRERRAEAHRDQQNLIGRTRADFAQRINEFGAGQELNAYAASLAAQERGYNANTALGQNQLRFMEGVNAPYPNAGQYAALASAAGQAGVDPFGGGGFGSGVSGGGTTVTRGGPWAGARNQSQFGGGAAPPDFGAGGGGFLSSGAFAPGQLNAGITAGFGGGGGGGILAGFRGPGPAPAQQGGGGVTPYQPQSGFGGGFGGYQQPQVADPYAGAGEEWLLDQMDQAPDDWYFGSDVGSVGDAIAQGV